MAFNVLAALATGGLGVPPRAPRAPPCPVAPAGRGGESGKGLLSSPCWFNIPEPLKLCAPPLETLGGGGGNSSWRRACSCSGRARRVSRSGEDDCGRGRLRALGEPRAAWDAATGPAPAGRAGCSHARSARAATRACAASMRCPSCARWQHVLLTRVDGF